MHKIAKRLSPNWLFTQVDNSPLVVFRFFFGLLVFAEAAGAIATGWVHRAFIATDFTFSWIQVPWLQPLPGNGMYFYFALMALCGLFIAAGYFYRVSTLLFALQWSAVYLMQKSHYNNHYYLLVLLAWLMFVLPANRRFSLDVKFGRVELKETCARICHTVFVVQVTLVYVIASLNKVHSDWLSADPIEIWFKYKENYPVIGGLLQKQWVHYFIAYGGVLYDGLIPFILLNHKTRKLGLFLSIFFNLFNSVVFQIGIFPYLMIAFSLFFYRPEQISKLFFRRRLPARESMPEQSPGFIRSVYFLFIFSIVFQVGLSVRHHLFTGNVHWTEEGHRMAWQMMLRAKSGYGTYLVVNNLDGTKEKINPRQRMSYKQAARLFYQPDLVWQYSRRLEKEYREKGWTDISIYFHGQVRLNKRPYAPLINPETDLLTVDWEPFKHAEWINPFPPEKNEKR